MKRIMLILLLYPLLLVSCSKEKNRIPEEYSFLIGKWVSAQTDGVYLLQIKPDYWEIKSNKFRDFKFKINTIVEDTITLNGVENRVLYCYQVSDYDYVAMIRFRFGEVDNQFDHTKSEIFFWFSDYGDYGSGYFSKL